MSLSIGQRSCEVKSNESYVSKDPQEFREHVEKTVSEISPFVYTIHRINEYLDKVEEEEENEFFEPLRREEVSLLPLGPSYQPISVAQSLIDTTQQISNYINEYGKANAVEIETETLGTFDHSITQTYQAFQNMLHFRKEVMLSNLKKWFTAEYISYEEGCRDSIKKLEKSILENANLSAGETEVFKKLPVEFCSVQLNRRASDDNLRQMEYMKARLVNGLFHQVCYLNKVKKFIEDHHIEIFKQFKQEPFEKPSFRLKFLGDETHNKGKKPVLVTFMRDHTEAFQIVYKHRDGKVDKLVLDLFKAINELPDDKKSMKHPLPFYQIISVSSSEQEHRSLHEFIKGKEIAVAASITCSELKDQTALDNLLRLEQISRAIGLTDLHRENVILTGKEWVPIDLEVIQEGSKATGLYQGKAPNVNKLTEEEQVLVGKFKKLVEPLDIRFVPIETASLISQSVSYEGYKMTTRKLFEYLEKSPLKPYLDSSRVEGLIKEDHYNGDIPIFINNRGSIYLSGSKIADPR